MGYRPVFPSGLQIRPSLDLTLSLGYIFAVMENLLPIVSTERCRIYRLAPNSNGAGRIARIIATTPESRAIMNDPFLTGVRYTEALESAVAEILSTARNELCEGFSERSTCVLHILRGGLNFGLRTALYRSFSWSDHASAFISSQRARTEANPEEWHITESSYKNIALPKNAAIVFGDVVATGTSLKHGLEQLILAADHQNSDISTLLFFTIGSEQSERILEEADRLCRERFPAFRGSTVVYLEGRFDVPGPDSKLSIRLTGTDLVRSNSVLAPEFIESQYECPSYPLERCTIYDAGSRAFWLHEYIEDLLDYWQQTAKLAERGVTFQDLLKERFPELDPGRFGRIDLAELCRGQVNRCERLLDIS